MLSADFGMRAGPCSTPVALWSKVCRFMDVILHVGAHRTGTTTLQSYLRQHRGALQTAGVEVWDPRRTRRGLFHGLRPGDAVPQGDRARRRALGRIKVNLEEAANRGVQTLVISDENLIGSVRENLRTRRLYPAIGERLARLYEALEGSLSAVVISTRSQDRYWPSACAYGVARGHKLPGKDACKQMASSRRRWRDVITDLACAVPTQDVRVLPFETYLGDARAFVKHGLGITANLPASEDWANRAPDLTELRHILRDRGEDTCALPGNSGPWHPFDAAQDIDMQEAYLDDLFWLSSGADGLATLIEEDGPASRGTAHPQPDDGGTEHEQENRHLA